MTRSDVFSTGSGMDICDLAMSRGKVLIALVPLRGDQCFEKNCQVMDRVIKCLRESTVALDSMNLGAIGGLTALAQATSQEQKLEQLKQNK